MIETAVQGCGIEGMDIITKGDETMSVMRAVEEKITSFNMIKEASNRVGSGFWCEHSPLLHLDKEDSCIFEGLDRILDHPCPSVHELNTSLQDDQLLYKRRRAMSLRKLVEYKHWKTWQSCDGKMMMHWMTQLKRMLVL